MQQTDPDFAFVDSHILCTPAIADIDGDGTDELVVSVSYFFDRDYYDNPHHAWQVEDLDPTKYIASEWWPGLLSFRQQHAKLLEH